MKKTAAAIMNTPMMGDAGIGVGGDDPSAVRILLDLGPACTRSAALASHSG